MYHCSLSSGERRSYRAAGENCGDDEVEEDHDLFEAALENILFWLLLNGALIHIRCLISGSAHPRLMVDLITAIRATCPHAPRLNSSETPDTFVD